MLLKPNIHKRKFSGDVDDQKQKQKKKNGKGKPFYFLIIIFIVLSRFTLFKFSSSYFYTLIL